MPYTDSEGNKKMVMDLFEDRADYMRGYYDDQKEVMDARHKQWVANNPEKVKAINARYREANREKRNEYNRQYRARKKAEKEAMEKRQYQKRQYQNRLNLAEIFCWGRR